jgi:TusA-related sulfurtransferase
MLSDAVVTIDVRDLAPPEPLQHIIAAMQRLEPGQVLRVWHRVEPCGLFPDLSPLGFSYQLTQSTEGFCEFVIWKTDDPRALEQISPWT